MLSMNNRFVVHENMWCLVKQLANHGLSRVVNVFVTCMERDSHPTRILWCLWTIGTKLKRCTFVNFSSSRRSKKYLWFHAFYTWTFSDDKVFRKSKYRETIHQHIITYWNKINFKSLNFFFELPYICHFGNFML